MSWQIIVMRNFRLHLREMLNTITNTITRSTPLFSKGKSDGAGLQVRTFLVVAVLCSFGLSTQIFGYTLRPERALVAFWLLAIIPLILRIRLRKNLPLLLLGWIVIALSSSAMSVEPRIAIRHWLDLSLAAGFFFVCLTLPLQLLITRRLTAMLWLASILGAGAILTAIIHSAYFVMDSHHVADPFWASLVTNDHFGAAIYGFRIKMTLLEANLFGIAMAIFSLFSIAELRKTDKWTWLPFVLSHAGLFLAFSRGPFLAYVLGLAVYIVAAGDKRISLRLWGVAFALLVFFPTDLPFSFDAAGGRERAVLAEQAKLRGQTLGVRFLAVSAALPDIYSRPVLGNGVYSFSFLHRDFYAEVGGRQGETEWLPVMPIAVLHDTGVLGFLALYSFFALILYRGYRVTATLRELANSQYSRRAGAWLGSAVLVTVASVSTSAYSLALFWGVFAVCYFIPRVLALPAQDSK